MSFRERVSSFFACLVWAATVPLGAASPGAAEEIAVAQDALRDKLYPVARTHAERVLETAAPGSNEAKTALLVVLEALSGEQKYRETLARIDTAVAKGQTIGPAPAVAYWRANAYLNLNEYAKARDAAAAATNAPSPYADALLRTLARAERGRGDLPAALAVYREADRSTNLLTRTDNALDWAQTLLESGDRKTACEVLDRQSEIGFESDSLSEGQLLRGRLFLEAGQAEQAGALFTRLSMDGRARETARVQALLELSVIALDGGKTNEAVAFARNAFGRAKEPATRRLAGFRLGDLLTASPATLKEGAKLIKALVQEQPEDARSVQAQLKLADAFLQGGSPAEAAAEYKIFLETYPSSSLDTRVLLGRGQALLKLNQAAEAGLAFKRAAEHCADREQKNVCLMKQADALAMDGQFTEAAAVYQEVAAGQPPSPYAGEALFQSADALERAGKFQEAASGYAAVTNRFAGTAIAGDAMLRLAALQSSRGDYAGAVATYTAVLKAKGAEDAVHTAWMGRGKVHYKAFRFEQALQDFASFAELSMEQKDEARFLMTLCLYGMGRDTAAKKAAIAFLADYPKSDRIPDMLLWLGKFSFNHADYAAAQGYFLDFVSRWPTSDRAESALLWAAQAAFHANDFTGCLEHVSKLLQERPKTGRMTEALLLQANALIELARFNEAILLLDRVITSAPNTDFARKALLHKADSLFTMGAGNAARYEEAMVAYRARLANGRLTETEELELHFKIARCLEKLDRTDEAIDQYYSDVMARYQDARKKGRWLDERSTTLYVKSAFSIASLYERTGGYEQAERILRRLQRANIPGTEEAGPRLERLKRRNKKGNG
ncbi:MAG: tetratricopeptide repeat protein [Kiritimatiellae bacterium]|nr:tetratricopeptide repeat protein [Kiritimatiellia bacterium]